MTSKTKEIVFRMGPRLPIRVKKIPTRLEWGFLTQRKLFHFLKIDIGYVFAPGITCLVI